jgi:GLPGLI family protein
LKNKKTTQMKKIALVASLATIGFAVTAFVAPKTSTDSTFEGVITYSISVDNPQAASMMQGSSMTIYVKGDKSKAYSDMGMEKITVFSDKNTPDDAITLLEIMGNKYQLKKDPAAKKDDDKAPDIKYTDDTKQIAGYTCHKATITVTGKDGQTYATDVYYTEEIPSGGSSQFKGLKGFPLEYAIKQQGMNISFSATKVTKQPVTDDTFVVPSGYKVMTAEEMQADIQKNMGGGN